MRRERILLKKLYDAVDSCMELTPELLREVQEELNKPQNPEPAGQCKVTHSAGIEWSGKDGVKRSFNIAKVNNGTVRMQLTTWWDGEDAEPMVTNIGLGQEAFDYFTDGIIAFRMRLSDFEIKDDAEDKQ